MTLRQRRDAQQLLKTPLMLHPTDDSGAPIALIEAARRSGRLRVLGSVDPSEVLVEVPFGAVPRRQTGCSRFVRLRNLSYALVLGPQAVEPSKDSGEDALPQVLRAA